ncbi:hypothetical protein CPAV1605_89 [seawater metagenome]|uniref:Glycosyl transferase family 25 domain-containing protein n=1 Tax=seawater metagenome TaxID=1561972 RepID=A0A5E8CH62_9ZZZZ
MLNIFSKVYVVSFKGSPRLERVEKHLKNLKLEFEIILGFTPNELNEYLAKNKIEINIENFKHSRLFDYMKKNKTNIEVNNYKMINLCVLLGHYRAMMRAVEDCVKYAIIIEDDADLSFLVKYFDLFKNEIQNVKLEKYKILKLSNLPNYSIDPFKHLNKINKTFIKYPIKDDIDNDIINGAGAYLITSDGLEEIHRKIPTVLELIHLAKSNLYVEIFLFSLCPTICIGSSYVKMLDLKSTVSSTHHIIRQWSAEIDKFQKDMIKEMKLS